MAEYYLDSSRTGGANNGSSWTDAFLTIAAALSAASAGDTIYMDDGHQQNLGTNSITFTSPGTVSNLLKLITCVTDTTTPVSNYGSRNFWTTSTSDFFSWTGHTYIYGVNFEPFDQFRVHDIDGSVILEKCLLHDPLGDNGSYIGGFQDGGRLLLLDSDVKGGWFAARLGTKIIWRGGSYITTGSEHTYLIEPSVEGGWIILDGVDLSAFPGSYLIESAAAGGDQIFQIQLLNCILPSGLTAITNGSYASSYSDNFIKLNGCGIDGSSGDAYYQIFEPYYAGDVSSETGVTHTGGATYDGTSLYTLELTTNTNAKEYLVPIRHKLCSKVIDANSTISIHIAYDDPLLYNDDVWLEVKHHDATDEALGAWVATAPTSAITTPDRTSFTDVSGTETWNGTAQDNEETIEVDITGASGLVDIWICLAKPSTTVYVDPKPVIS